MRGSTRHAIPNTLSRYILIGLLNVHLFPKVPIVVGDTPVRIDNLAFGVKLSLQLRFPLRLEDFWLKEIGPDSRPGILEEKPR